MATDGYYSRAAFQVADTFRITNTEGMGPRLRGDDEW
jgi:hypothetical protein